MTNTTYDLKPGYYWKITPSTDPDRAAVLSLMQLTTAWTSDNVVAQYSLEHVPATRGGNQEGHVPDQDLLPTDVCGLHRGCRKLQQGPQEHHLQRPPLKETVEPCLILHPQSSPSLHL